LYVLVLEKVRGSPLPRRYLGIAIRRLSKWFSFRKVYEAGSRRRVKVYIAADEDSLNALKALHEVYGYEVMYVKRLDHESQGLGELLSIIWGHALKRVSEDTEKKRIKRILITYGPILRSDVLEKAVREHGIDIVVAKRVRKSLTGTVVLALKLRNPRPEAFYALCYPFFVFTGFPPAYIVPLGRSVEVFRQSRKAKASVKDVHELVNLLLKECGECEELEQLSKCERAVAQKYHASWRSLLKKVKMHILYIELLARVLVKELERLEVEVLSYEVWRVRARGRWTAFTRRQLLDLLATHPELTVREACKIIGISYITARHYLKDDKEYKEIIARRRAQRLQVATANAPPSSALRRAELSVVK
jgi:hypothetical protein